MNVDSPELKRFRELVLDLNVQWQMFDELFMDAKNYAVLNRTGPSFWVHFQTYLLETLYLSISRFFDSAGNQFQANLSLARVIELPEVAPIRVELEQRLREMSPTWEKGIRIWRHKKLSHSDMPTTLGAALLPNIPHAEVRDLVSGISEFVREIDHRMNQVDVSYHCSLRGWTPQILRYLELGVEKQDEKLAQLRPSAFDLLESDDQ